MLDITNIPPPRVPLIDDRTGLMSREWYRFLLSLFRLTGGGSNDITLQDLQLGPQAQVDFGDLNDSYNQAQLAANCLSAQQVAENSQLLPANDNAQWLQSQMQSIELQSQVSTLSSQLSDVQNQLQALSLSPAHTPHIPRLRYGSFFDTTTQTAAAINTAYGMTFNTTDISNGVTIGSPTSRVYVDTKNVYNIQFSAQVEKTDPGTDVIDIWLRKNGNNINDTNTSIDLSGSGAEYVASWNWLVQSNAGDYYEIVWSSADLNMRLLATVAATNVSACFGKTNGSIVVITQRVALEHMNTRSMAQLGRLQTPSTV